MYNFELVKPSTLQDAVAALKSEDAQALGGGQTLLPTMKARLAMTEQLVALSGIDEIKGICTDDDGRICIGGATTHTAVAEGATGYPALASLAARIGDPAVRNRGTIGGSLANNDPSACYPAGALASNATIVT
ncbi:MAG: FAD binding domain-containing protein, partial [Jannaschia helgolandensis]